MSVSSITNKELDKRLKEIKVSTDDNNKLQDGCGGTVLDEEVPGRTAFQPQVRILKRDTLQCQSNVNSSNCQRQPAKTLEQREAEYLEARQRIFGSTDELDTAEVETNKGPIMIAQPPTESVSIARQPKGPDGSDGFKIER